MAPPRSKINLRLPPDLAAESAHIAAAMGVSLNAFLTLAVRNWVAYQKRGMGSPPSPPRRPAQAPIPPPVGGKVGRNDPCPCGSGRKFKHCHGKP